MIFSRRLSIYLLALVCAFYACCALRLASVHLPFCDEGWLASPGWNLVTHGSMETSAIEPKGSYLTGIDRYTYWIAPGYPLALAGWYSLFGFGALEMRSFSVFCGVVALASLFFLIRQLSASPLAALLATAFTAFALPFVSAGSAGRMDMEAAAFGFAGLALYVNLRETRHRAAMLSAHSLLAMSILSHPNGLILLLVLAVITILLDRDRLRITDLLLAAAPYAAGVGLWEAYIARGGFALFLAQFGGNATNGGRGMIVQHPIRSLLLEFERYGVAFGFYAGGLRRLQCIPLVFWIAGLLAAVLLAGIRKRKHSAVLLAAAPVSACALLVLDGVKRPIYLVYVVPLLTAGLALSAAWLWRARPALRAATGAGVAALLITQTGILFGAMGNNAYARQYMPVISWLRLHAGPSALIMGPSELGFELGFTPRLVDDFRLGYNSGKRAEFIVIDPNYRAEMRNLSAAHPEIGAFLGRTLAGDYRAVFSNDVYTIYARNASLPKLTRDAAASIIAPADSVFASSRPDRARRPAIRER